METPKDQSECIKSIANHQRTIESLDRTITELNDLRSQHTLKMHECMNCGLKLLNMTLPSDGIIKPMGGTDKHD